MDITQKRGRFIINSSGKEYTVDLAKEICTCPHFMYRLRGTGQKCKHILAVQDHLTLRRRDMDKLNEDRYELILSFVRREGPVDAIKLIERWGEEEVNFLLFRGDLIEERGMIRVV
jgi:predicted nucleic acid-binding Zn finger protein